MALCELRRGMPRRSRALMACERMRARACHVRMGGRAAEDTTTPTGWSDQQIVLRQPRGGDARGLM